MIKVYAFETFDETSGDYVRSPRKGSEEEVPEDLVDQYGVYNPATVS